MWVDRATPAILIEAIRLSPQIRQDTLAKATLTPSNNLSATLHLHVTLCSQGIFAGDIVTLVTRHARVFDPYGVQHTGTRTSFSTSSVSCRIFHLPPFSPNWWSTMKAPPWNLPHDFRIAIFPRNHPSTCALGAIRMPIPSKTLSGPSQHQQPGTHQEHQGYPHKSRLAPKDIHCKPRNRNTA